MSSRSPQFGRTGSKEARPAASDANNEGGAEDRHKTRHDDINRRNRLGMATRDMNRLSSSGKSHDK